jgi:hypothetical protein
MVESRGDEAEGSRAAVHSVRTSLRDTADELGDRVDKATDLREQIRAHPMAALAVGTVAGVVIGRQLSALLGVGGMAALGAGAALRAAPPSNGRFFADRLVRNVGAALASAIVVPVVSGIQKLVESNRAHVPSQRVADATLLSLERKPRRRRSAAAWSPPEQPRPSSRWTASET